MERNDYKIVIDGIEIKRSESFDLPEEYENMEVQTKEMQGSIECKYKPNKLWLIQQRTGHPNNVEIPWWI